MGIQAGALKMTAYCNFQFQRADDTVPIDTVIFKENVRMTPFQQIKCQIEVTKHAERKDLDLMTTTVLPFHGINSTHKIKFL